MEKSVAAENAANLATIADLVGNKSRNTFGS